MGLVSTFLQFTKGNRQLTPAFTLIANGVDVTAKVNENLVYISLSDTDGDVSDELTIKVAGDIRRPKQGDKLLFSIGYKESGVVFLGTFFVQTTERENGYLLTITATSVNWSDNLKEQRDHKYEKTDVKKIAKEIAGRYKLKLKCDCEDITLAYIAQQDESDLEFLGRISEKYDLIFNIKNETLTLLHRMKDDKKNTSLPRFTLDAFECETIRIKHSSKRFYKSVKAQWRDTKTNKQKEVKIGEENPLLKIRDDFADENEAKSVAKAKLQKANRQVKIGSLTHHGVPVVAGGILILFNTGEDDGVYPIKTVTHTLDDQGWMTDMEIEA